MKLCSNYFHPFMTTLTRLETKLECVATIANGRALNQTYQWDVDLTSVYRPFALYIDFPFPSTKVV